MLSWSTNKEKGVRKDSLCVSVYRCLSPFVFLVSPSVSLAPVSLPSDSAALSLCSRRYWRTSALPRLPAAPDTIGILDRSSSNI